MGGVVPIPVDPNKIFLTPGTAEEVAYRILSYFNHSLYHVVDVRGLSGMTFVSRENSIDGSLPVTQDGNNRSILIPGIGAPIGTTFAIDSPGFAGWKFEFHDGYILAIHMLAGQVNRVITLVVA